MLPNVTDAASFGATLFESGRWTALIEWIAERHRLPGPFVQSHNGSTVVFLSADACIKVHPPLPGFIASHHREVAALKTIAGLLPIATPEFIAEGEVDGWVYFISTRLRGTPIDAAWDSLDATTRQALATELGEAVAALHRVDPQHVAAVTEPWSTFRPAQRARAVDLERDKGLSTERLDALDRWLAMMDAVPEPDVRPTLLHTEIGPSHVLIAQGRITGLIDFGDCGTGDPEYDLAPVGMFVTRGDPAAFRAFATAYGLSPDIIGDIVWRRRLLRHALLHRYGTLAWYLDELRPPSDALDTLASHWFGVS
jgi:hygromycin-B 7''-O-kinase